MRYVGNEITSHGVNALALSYIARQHNRTGRLELDYLHRKRHSRVGKRTERKWVSNVADVR